MSSNANITGIPIGLYSVLSIVDLRIKRAGKPWRTVRAMAWRPEELTEFLRNLRGPKTGV
jgi:hypothetical protein